VKDGGQPKYEFEMTTPDQAVLQKNTRLNLIRTLEDFSDRQRQEKYKRAVPFVHVPIELLAQWDNYSHHLRGRRNWFIESFTARELVAMEKFDAAVEAFACDEPFSDVPEIFEEDGWVQLMHGASLLLDSLNAENAGCQ